MRFWTEMALLTMESQRVVALRLAKLARGGPAALAESHRMVGEKIGANLRAATRAATGAHPTSIVRDYRRTVRANAKRLGKG